MRQTNMLAPVYNPPTWINHKSRRITREIKKTIITPVLTEIAKQCNITVADLETGNLHIHATGRKVACYVLYRFGLSHKNISEIVHYSKHGMSCHNVAMVNRVLSGSKHNCIGDIKHITVNVLQHFNLSCTHTNANQ